MKDFEMAPWNIEDVLDRQCQRLRDFEIATTLIKSKEAMKEDLFDMISTISRVSDDIGDLRKHLQTIKEENDQLKELLSLTKALEEKIIHMGEHIPAKLVLDYMNSTCTAPVTNHEKTNLTQLEMTVNNGIEKHDKSMKNCKKTLFNEPDVIPALSMIFEEEFNKIPQYLIRRQSLETVNNFISTINQVLKAKYSLLSLGKANARKSGNLNLYLDYKKQEMDICQKNEQIYFFCQQDYERWIKMKLDKLKLNLLTLLRHCKRLREYRVKNDLHYIVITE